MSVECEHKFYITTWVKKVKFADNTLIALIKCKCSDCGFTWKQHREYTYTARILNTPTDRGIEQHKRYNSLFPSKSRT